MTPDFELRVAQALTDHGGPPEIAPQLVALGDHHGLSDELLNWITFHMGSEWSAAQFNEWCWKLRRTSAAVRERARIARAGEVLKEMR